MVTHPYLRTLIFILYQLRDLICIFIIIDTLLTCNKYIGTIHITIVDNKCDDVHTYGITTAISFDSIEFGLCFDMCEKWVDREREYKLNS